MKKEAYIEAKKKFNIFDDAEARNALNFALVLLDAEILHIKETDPCDFMHVSRLGSSHTDLCLLSGDLDEFMDIHENGADENRP